MIIKLNLGLFFFLVLIGKSFALTYQGIEIPSNYFYVSKVNNGLLVSRSSGIVSYNGSGELFSYPKSLELGLFPIHSYKDTLLVNDFYGNLHKLYIENGKVITQLMNNKYKVTSQFYNEKLYCLDYSNNLFTYDFLNDKYNEIKSLLLNSKYGLSASVLNNFSIYKDEVFIANILDSSFKEKLIISKFNLKTDELSLDTFKTVVHFNSKKIGSNAVRTFVNDYYIFLLHNDNFYLLNRKTKNLDTTFENKNQFYTHYLKEDKLYKTEIDTSDNSINTYMFDDSLKRFILIYSIKYNLSGLGFYRVLLIDNDLYIAGSNATLLKSSNYGETWEVISSSHYSTGNYRMYWQNENVGMLYSIEEFKVSTTTNGGATWRKNNIDSDISNEFKKVPVGVGFITKDSSFVIYQYRNNRYNIFKSIDGGFSFTKIKSDFDKQIKSKSIFNYGNRIYCFSNEHPLDYHQQEIFVIDENYNKINTLKIDSLYSFVDVIEDDNTWYYLGNDRKGKKQIIKGVTKYDSMNLRIVFSKDKGKNWETLVSIPDSLKASRMIKFKDKLYILCTEDFFNSNAINRIYEYSLTSNKLKLTYNNIIKDPFDFLINSDKLELLLYFKKKLVLNGDEWEEQETLYDIPTQTFNFNSLGYVATVNMENSPHRSIFYKYGKELRDTLSSVENYINIDDFMHVGNPYPHPVKATVNIDYEASLNINLSNITVNLFDINGSEINLNKSQISIEPKNSSSFVIKANLENLELGVYFIKVSSNYKTQYTKIIISR